jgi:hypothetical protein
MTAERSVGGRRAYAVRIKREDAITHYAESPSQGPTLCGATADAFAKIVEPPNPESRSLCRDCFWAASKGWHRIASRKEVA